MNIQDLAFIFKIIGDESRLKIIFALFKKDEICGNDLLKVVNCGQPTLSHHMRLLVSYKIVRSRRDGKWIYYSLNKELLTYLGDLLKGNEYFD